VPSDAFTWKLDPDAIDESVRGLADKARRLWDQGRYTKVRIKYKGRAILPDIPLAAMVAAEGMSLWIAGPLRLLVVNLGANVFLEVELVHEASERVRDGQDLFAQGEVDSAEAKYREALAMKPDDGAALYNLGVLLRVTGRREDAIACFEKVATLVDHPDQPRAVEALDRMRRGAKSL
jgi:tetratricopeptide (TPR) repeat protein